MKPQEKPIHIGADEGSIAELVLLPGDPLRAKYIADNFLEDAVLVNNVRNMFGYTGFYKGKKVSVISSGMGIPSAGIYVFELFYYYNVKKIIRIGTCGSLSEDVKLLDLVVSESVYTESIFAMQMTGRDEHYLKASVGLNEQIMGAADELGLNPHVGTISTTTVFTPYCEADLLHSRYPKDLNCIAEEMEGFAVCYLANEMNREATVILSVVDSPFTSDYVSVDDRQTSLNDMIKLALEAIIK